jgi:hypothetical protein
VHEFLDWISRAAGETREILALVRRRGRSRLMISSCLWQVSFLALLLLNLGLNIAIGGGTGQG